MRRGTEGVYRHGMGLNTGNLGTGTGREGERGMEGERKREIERETKYKVQSAECVVEKARK